MLSCQKPQSTGPAKPSASSATGRASCDATNRHRAEPQCKARATRSSQLHGLAAIALHAASIGCHRIMPPPRCRCHQRHPSQERRRAAKIVGPMMDVSEMAAKIAGLMNSLAMIAAPQLHTTIAAPEVLRWTAETAKVLLAEPRNFTAYGTNMERFREELQALSTMLEESPDAITSELIARARACFAALGAGEPPEGWDQFTGEWSA